MAKRRKKIGRPKSKSLKSRVTTPERVRVIVELMVANWNAKAVAVMGSKTAAGGVNYGGAHVGDRVPGLGQELGEEDYVSTWDEKVPPMTTSSGGDWQESGARPLARPLATSGLMTLEKARKVVDFTCSRLITFCRLSLSGEKPSWRRWQSFSAAIALVEWERRKAYAEIDLAALQKGERSGWQRISTSRKARLPRGQLTSFSGKPAWSGALGRPPLPESEWLNRYRSRLQKRRAKYKGKRRPGAKSRGTKPPLKRKWKRTRATLPVVPPTKTQRPPYKLELARK